MNQYEIEKLIQDTKELRDIRDEYQKTERLLKENKQEELQQHLQEVSSKHLLEKLAYNAVNSQMPQTLEQSARNCMVFLDGLLKEKLALKIKELFG